MLGQILGYLGECINACLGWFSDIIESTGTYRLIIGVFTMIVMFRVLIVPLIGGSAITGGSDFVQRLRHNRDEQKFRKSFKPMTQEEKNHALGDGK